MYWVFGTEKDAEDDDDDGLQLIGDESLLLAAMSDDANKW
mgnify:CR=1 FL=1